mmetsp:Transcript_53496/g.61311  ORF Transcript_53496/g.61311 Transcript_53496/m.61311 type:complete len:90 (+) Transcript_53496:87-356(+)
MLAILFFFSTLVMTLEKYELIPGGAYENEKILLVSTSLLFGCWHILEEFLEKRVGNLSDKHHSPEILSSETKHDSCSQVSYSSTPLYFL